MDGATYLEAAAVALAAIHFGVPLAYYLYLRRAWLHRPWGLRRDPGYTPRVSIIIPTYMGARHIARRLDNIAGQNYPLDRVEVVVVDSASPDGTADEVRKWAGRHPEVNLRLIVERVRRGKFAAVLEGLRHASRDSDMIVLTDDDCLWDPDALRRVASYFSDPRVGAVTGSIKYQGDGGVHNAYRSLYNQVRIAESKWWSTPVHNGPLLALRREAVERIGFPTLPGADDSAIASYIAFAGYRAIQADDVWVYEYPARDQHKRMIRRAAHLMNYFTRLKRHAKQRGVYVKTPFDKIWRVEAYLHIVSPLLLAAAIALLIASILGGNIIGVTLLTIGLALLAYKPYKSWMISQLYLLIALPRVLVGVREEAWQRPKTLQ